MGHSFYHRYCITTSYKGKSICLLPGFSDDGFLCSPVIQGQTFSTEQSVEERWRHNVDCRGLELAIPKRGVSFLCDKYWQRYSPTQPAITCPISQLMSVPCPLSFPFLGANFHVNLLFFMEMPLSMLDLISMHSATNGCCSL